MASTPTPRMLPFDRHLAMGGIVIGGLALASGLAMLLMVVGAHLGLLAPSAASLLVGQVLGFVGIAVMVMGALGNITVFATAPLRNQTQFAATPLFFTSLSNDDSFTSSLDDIQPPPPRSQRGATATTRRPSED